jgi:ferredoxin
MPKIEVWEVGVFDVPAGKRLVNALTDECGIDQLHSCGGQPKCTTCRVEIVAGTPSPMTVAEKAVLDAKGFAERPDVRLSCQITCDNDLTVRCISRFAGSGKKDSGPRPPDAITPPPAFVGEG